MNPEQTATGTNVTTMPAKTVGSSLAPRRLAPGEKRPTDTRPTHPKLSAEYDRFLAKLPQLLAEHRGRYVAMDDGEIICVGDTEAGTLTEADRLRPGELILVRLVTENQQAPEHAVAPSLMDILTLSSLAAYLQLPESAVLQESQAGRIPGRCVAGEWRFSRGAILDWLGDLQGPAAVPRFPRPLTSPGAAYTDEDPEEVISAIYRERKKHPVGG